MCRPMFSLSIFCFYVEKLNLIEYRPIVQGIQRIKKMFFNEEF